MLDASTSYSVNVDSVFPMRWLCPLMRLAGMYKKVLRWSVFNEVLVGGARWFRFLGVVRDTARFTRVGSPRWGSYVDRRLLLRFVLLHGARSIALLSALNAATIVVERECVVLLVAHDKATCLPIEEPSSDAFTWLKKCGAAIVVLHCYVRAVATVCGLRVGHHCKRLRGCGS